MRYLGINSDNKIVFNGSMPESDAEMFKLNNTSITLFPNTKITDTTNILGKTYNRLTGEITGETQPLINSTSLKIPRAEFKLLFTAQERIAIKQARNTDSLLQEYYEVLDDPSVISIDLNLQSTKDLVALLITKNLLTQQRANEVLSRTFK